MTSQTSRKDDDVDMDVIETVPGQVARIVPGEEAQRLADLTGIQRDLRLVEEACRVVHARREAPAAAAIRRACFDSAVMRYRRCFKNAVRDLLPQSMLGQLTAAELTLHNQVLALADRSVAHCVDGSEENWTYVLVGPKTETEMPLEVCVFTRTVSHHNVVSAEAFEALARRVREVTRAECDQIARAVLAQLRPMNGSDILALEEPRSYIKDGVAGAEKYRRRRKAARTRT